MTRGMTRRVLLNCPCGDDRRDCGFEDQLFLVVGFEYDGIFIESLDLSHQSNPTKKENRNKDFIATHRVEVYVLNALNR